MNITDDIQHVKGIGPAIARRYAQCGIRTVADLVQYYPRRYNDYSSISTIKQLKPGHVTIKAIIQQATGKYVRRGLHVTEAVASDQTGSVRLVWFNQPYRAATFKGGAEYYISGTFELRYQRFAIQNPHIELESEFPLSTARIVPTYRESKELNSRQIRSALRNVLSLIRTLPETLPKWLVTKNQLMTYPEAIEQIHFPTDADHLVQAKERLAFEEVLCLRLASLLNKLEIMQEKAPIVPFEERVAKEFVRHLPFTLTDAQRRTIWQIYLDMQNAYPMNRLVEGDVGSGKTVVAAMAAVMVLYQGHQVALMAPTEILARQHAETLIKLFRPLGLDQQIGLLVGSMSQAQKNRAHTSITNGNMKFMVGTHALIQEKVDMHNLELIIIDEQHRFGVEQRKSIIAKAGHMPHVLNLTATPIPRSLALTLYGELDVSLLDARPANRMPIETEICSPNSRTQLYERIKKELQAGRQMFVVCPRISESKASSMHSAEKVYEQLSKSDFKDYSIGLLHGKMKGEEKNSIMQAFAKHELDILVATTVIEVGVDIPNATVMLIEDADRFGLAQIHQLRGRIGRGGHAGYCYLMMSDSKAPSARLRAIERSNDGFRLAELDLQLRGPGAIYGTMQHGALDLRFAQLTDTQLIVRVDTAAKDLIEKGDDLLQYKQLYERVKNLRAVTNLN